MLLARAMRTVSNSLEMVRRWLHPLVVFCLMFVSVSLASAKEPWPWHVDQSPDLVSLYLGVPQPESDADSPVADCAPRSGTIKIFGLMNAAMRSNVVNAMKDDGILTVTLGLERIPPVYFSKFSISYSDMDGWVYEIAANDQDPYLKTFRKTGAIVFKMGDLVVERVNEPTTAIENIGKFIDACAKPRQP